MSFGGWAVAMNGGLLALAWVASTVAAARGLRRVAELTRPEHAVPPGTALPRVSIVVPARNEAAGIEAAVRSLMALDYPAYEVVAVDDRSEDATGAILDRLEQEFAGRLRVVHVHALPAGWLGKTNAMHAAASQCRGEWLLFTDADVVHAPDALRRAVHYAECEQADHFVLLPTIVMQTWGEHMMIALFQALFIFQGHRPWMVADAKAKDHLGVGAFNLIRHSAYEAIGGHQALRLSVVDDMKLAERVKQHGLCAQLAFGENLVRVRWAVGARGVVRNLTKNFFAELRYSLGYALTAALGLLWLQLGPWLGALFAPGWARAGYLVALACLALIYVAMGRRTHIPLGYLLLHPVATLVMVFTMLRSTVLTLARGGVEWRGTFYPLDELRKAG